VRWLLKRAQDEMLERECDPMDEFMDMTSAEEGVSNVTVAASKAPWTTPSDGSSELIEFDS
jgi:hypothetical protein